PSDSVCTCRRTRVGRFCFGVCLPRLIGSDLFPGCPMPSKSLGVWLSLLLVIASSAPSSAQAPRNTKPFTRFKIFLQGILNDTLPFDVPFIVWGDVPDPNADHVTCEISVMDSGANCGAVQPAKFNAGERRELQKWTQQDFLDRSL